jgi:hypothetical protein
MESFCNHGKTCQGSLKTNISYPPEYQQFKEVFTSVNPR